MLCKAAGSLMVAVTSRQWFRLTATLELLSEPRWMREALFFCLLVCLPAAAQEAPIPTPTALPGSPFFIKKNWFIGGAGNWDYLALDPTAQRLYIAHSHSVQVVDVSSGALAGEIPGFREAHAIALDDTGTYGYVSDGPAAAVAVFDRRMLSVSATIPIGCSPRSIAFEPSSRLVFAVCGANVANPRPPRPHGRETPVQPAPEGISHIIVINADKNVVLIDMTVAGDFRFAQADGAGQVYITVGEVQQTIEQNGHATRQLYPRRIAQLDGPAIAAEATRRQSAQSQPSPDEPLHIDWSPNADSGSFLHFFRLPDRCSNPQGLAVDSRNLRLFAACDNQQLLVLNSRTGDLVTSLITGPGSDVVGYDADRNLIYSANGAGYGSLTIIRQSANSDTYAIIQNLPTLARARTLAIDPSTGNVYLVTDYMGVDLTPRGGFGTIKPVPIAGSFQVLVVGH